MSASTRSPKGKIANILHARGELDEALRIYLEDVIPVDEQLSAVHDLLMDRRAVARIYLDRNTSGDRDRAAELLHLALADAESMRIPEAEEIRTILRNNGLPESE